MRSDIEAFARTLENAAIAACPLPTGLSICQEKKLSSFRHVMLGLQLQFLEFRRLHLQPILDQQEATNKEYQEGFDQFVQELNQTP